MQKGLYDLLLFLEKREEAGDTLRPFLAWEASWAIAKPRAEAHLSPKGDSTEQL